MDNKTEHLLKIRHLQMFLQIQFFVSAQPDRCFLLGMSLRIFCVGNMDSRLLGTWRLVTKVYPTILRLLQLTVFFCWKREIILVWSYVWT